MSLVTYERRFFAGIDIGQVNDSTAIGIIERIRPLPKLEGLHHALHDQAREAAANETIRLDLVHLERIPLGTQYPEQVERIRNLLHKPMLRGTHTYLDATGVGLGPFQMLKKAGVRDLHSIKITSSTAGARKTGDGWNVGKAELVNAVQIEMQTGRLRIGRQIPEAAVLERELREFRSRQSANGNLTFGAREGQHDDSVLALTYAVFGATRPSPVTHLDVRFVA